MGFTKRALEEQEFLKTKYKELWRYYDEMMGTICIPGSMFQSREALRREVFAIIGEKTEHSRYVLYRDMVSDYNGDLIPGYIVSSADFAE